MATHVETERERKPYNRPYTRSRDVVEDAHTIMVNRISWGAVFAGVVIALVTQLILNMIGVGVGAATIDPATAGGTPSLFNFSLSAAIWWTVSGIIAAFIGGFAAGRLAGEPRQSTAAWHGLTSWALATLMVFYLLTTSLTALIGGTVNAATGVVGAVGNTLGTAVTTTAATAGDVAASDEVNFEAIIQDIQQMAQAEVPQEAVDSAIASVRAAVTGEGVDDPQAIEEAAQALAEVRDIPVAEARIEVEGYVAQYQQTVATAQEGAVEIADTASDTVASTALLGALALLLGAIAAWFGGRAGSVKPTDTYNYGTSRRHVDEEGVVH